MSDCERITQVAHDKWATMSNLIMINERISDSLTNFWLKKSKILFFSMFYIIFFYLKNERFTNSLFFNERCERIAQVPHQKWATMSESLRLLTKNEQIGRFFEQIDHLLTKNEQMAHFFCKKRAICSENRWANSQPCTVPKAESNFFPTKEM